MNVFLLRTILLLSFILRHFQENISYQVEIICNIILLSEFRKFNGHRDKCAIYDKDSYEFKKLEQKITDVTLYKIFLPVKSNDIVFLSFHQISK